MRWTMARLATAAFAGALLAAAQGPIKMVA